MVFALITMTLFLQLNSGVEVYATTNPEFNETEINKETSKQLKMLDPYLKDVDGITSFDYDAAMHDNVDPVVLKIGAEINKWARSLKNDGPEKGMLLSMARFNLLVYGNYCGKGNNGKAPIDDLDGACQAHDTCYAWGGNNEKCNQKFRQRLLTIMQKTSLFDYKHIVAVAAYKLFGG
ncbi:phospholipase A2 family protein [Lacticaseibacillus paracasei]|uniref:Phospholipase A2 family protein n=1 Tax=Lacticaseibacillus paracasei TaxID=1597 RepID=A0ABD5D3U4_LACPA|nr:phospholipase A2 family protein [Lacticaseibacillus paracasei]MDR7625740.1 phospholipase A2 family protein [Lacticaseibacillus paracasei]QPC14816.1 phospholipase [Lacticaseibacillus paracasei subsp. tolerans]QUT00096.1 phospholipase [Lacticaseibacillus paracasei subsp. tolerans]WMX61811.1 phospholipase A2 family protein [Lacticaseibacillus paracasei]